ncbi:sensor histidine kinase [Desulfurivibrio sp. D14AmB]|uniref:sensor histidine kinase n=1 Tax=Desulfurivibrio sp. D14AmB TaxID=3374370 RepID=UPI00376F2DD0
MSANLSPVGSPEVARWENAYLEQLATAAVGRLFRGVIHNLNGVLQVSSLHGDMSAMVLHRAAELVGQLATASTDRAAALRAELEALVVGQRDSVDKLQEKTRQGTQILRRVLELPPLSPGSAPPWTLNEVLACEVEFLSADPFFKHKVVKELEPAAQLPPLGGDLLKIHQIVYLLLDNALAAVRDQVEARIEARISRNAAGLELLLGDNGPGIAPAHRERIFEPFFTTRPEAMGLGLYLARKLARLEGGELTCLEAESGALFRLLLPTA